MRKKDKAILIAALLLPIVPIMAMVLGNQNEWRFMTNMTIVLVWSAVFALISLRDYVAKRGPKLSGNASTPQNNEEIAFSYPNSLLKYLLNVYFNPTTIKLKTWNYLQLIAYLLFLINIGFSIHHTIVLFIIVIFTFAASFFVTLTGYIQNFKKTKASNIITIVNKNGLMGAVPRLSNRKGKSIDYIYVSHVSWKAVENIFFHKIHIEITYDSNKKLFLFAGKNEKISQMKDFFAQHYANKEMKEIVNLKSYKEILPHIATISAAIVAEECNLFQLGDSYIAPIPSVPKGFKWPVNHKLPLTFVAQINCEDIANFHYNNDYLLPKKGMLYFFYEMKEMLFNETGNRGCARIIYSDVPANELYFHKESTKFTNPHFWLRQRKLKFQPSFDFPTFHDAGQLDSRISNSNEETYNYTKWSYKQEVEQGESITNNIGNLLGEPKIDKDKLVKENDSEHLVLLLQLTIDKTDFFSYHQNTVADIGKDFYESWPELPCQLFYFVPREDLERMDFSNMRFACRSLNVESIDFDQQELTKI